MSRAHHAESRFQQPTTAAVRIRSVQDAHIIFHAVMTGILPMVTRRLDTEERRAVRAGNVYVWEERGRNAEATGLGIERWTDGIRWSASRVRDEFLLYHERDTTIDIDFNDIDGYANPESATNIHSDVRANNRLVKQTYSVFVETTQGRRKWHLTAYYIPASINQLRTVDDFPHLASIRPPEGMYTSAKVGKGRALPVSGATDIHRGSVPSMTGPLPSLGGHHHPQGYPTFAPYPNANVPLTPPPGHGSPHHISYGPGPQGAPALVIPGGQNRSQGGPSPASSSSSSSGHWPSFHSPPFQAQRDGRTLPILPPPSLLGLSPTSPNQSVHGTGGYSPRHPLDNEALRAFNKPI